MLNTTDNIEMYSDKYVITVEDGVKVESIACFKATVRQRKVSHMDRLMGRAFFDNLRQMSFCVVENDLSYPLTLKVTPQFEFENYNVRPFNGRTQRKENTVEIEITGPTKISLEFDGNIFENLFVFIDSPKQVNFSDTDDNVLYFGKGVHDVGDIRLTDGQTLYLDNGAFVYGSVYAENAKNIRICGNGIICGGKYNHDPRLPRICEFQFCNCENILVEDVTIIDSPCWTLCFDCCKNIRVTNVKEICNAINSDGIDLTACEDVVVSDCFFRNFDDNVSVKAKHEKLVRDLTQNLNVNEENKEWYFGDSRNILVKNCVFWADAAHPMLVGPEAEPSAECVFENIVFQDITVLQHREFSEVYQGVMAIFCADNAVIRNITFKDICVDRMDCGRLISVIYTTEYASMIGKHVENVLFENITYNGEEIYVNRIQGHDENHVIDNVTVKNLVIRHQKQTDKYDLFGEAQFVNGLKVE